MPTTPSSVGERLRRISHKRWGLIVLSAIIGGIGVAATMSSALAPQWGLLCILIGYCIIGIWTSQAKNPMESTGTRIPFALLILGAAIILLHFFGLLDWL